MWSGNAMNDSGMIVAWHTPGGEKMYGPWGIFPSGAAKVGAASSMASRFVGLKEGSAEFDVQWRAAAQEDPAGFAALQRAYVKRTSYDPSVAMILSDEKIDITKQSLAIQELVFTWTSMTGQGDTFFRWAADAMRSAGKWNPSSADFDRDLLSALYSAMEKTRYFQKNPKQFTRFKTAIGQSSVGGDCR
jgi:hypothetical protein